MGNAAVFFDRDGVLVEEIFYEHTGEVEAPLAPEDVKLLPGAADAVRAARDAGFHTIVVSNQGGYAKGKTSLRALWLAHLRFLELLAEGGAALDECFYSYGHPEGVTPHFSGVSLDRKPGPYNLFIAAARFDLDLTQCWIIGDRETDVACGRAAGAKAVRIAPQKTSTAAAFLADGVVGAVSYAIQSSRGV